MLFENTKAAFTAMERLATGSKINKAQDDVAGSAIAERMTSQVRGLNMAVKNVNDAMAMLSVADSAASDITDMLQRMRELAIQAANDTNSAADRQYLQDEVNSLIQEIDRVATQTQYNGENLLDGTKKGSIQIGSQGNQTTDIAFRSFHTSSFDPVLKSLASTQSTSGPNTDLTKPVLTSLTQDKTVVDVTNGGQTVELNLSALDDSKINHAQLQFRHKVTGKNFTTNANIPSAGVDGGSIPPIVFNFTQDHDAGIWELVFMQFSDIKNNLTMFDQNDIDSGFQVEVVGGNTDLTKPVLTSLTQDKTVVDVTNGGQTVELNLSALDDSKINHAQLQFRHKVTGKNFTTNANIPSAGVDGGSIPPIVFNFTQDHDAGIWELVFMQFSDIKNNLTMFDQNDIDSGFQVEVVGGNTDLTKPVLTSLTQDKTVVDVTNGGQTVELNLSALDDSKINHAQLQFRHKVTGKNFTTNANIPSAGVDGGSIPPIVFNFTQDHDAGIWELVFMQFSDIKNNLTMFDQNDIDSGFQVEVVGGNIAATTTNQSHSWSQTASLSGSSSYTPTGTASQSYSWSPTASLSGSSAYTATGAASQSYKWSLYNFSSLNITESSSPINAIASIDAAIEAIMGQRAEHGALQNRLHYTISNLMSVSENTVAARSRIEDADFATESAALAKTQVLQQTGAAMLAQANARPQLVLQLIK
jgi:flagellin